MHICNGNLIYVHICVWTTVVLLKQVCQLHNSGFDILVLCHRPNTERNSWYTFATPGRAGSFLENQNINVLDAWKEFICSRTHRSSTGEHLMVIF